MAVFSSRICKINCFHFLAVTTLFLVAELNPAAAQFGTVCGDKIACSDHSQNDVTTVKTSSRHLRGSPSRSVFARVQVDANGNEGTIIGGRPAGCPHNYCGCGLRAYLGISDKRFNLAWNWAKYFPRTSAHAGAAAVRPGHVMLLESQVSGTVWIVRDYNSGRGLSRIHERDVRGYVFVDPHAGQHLASRS
jgi:hypothetical protein